MLEVYESNKMRTVIARTIDVLICSASFEDRSKSAAELVGQRSVQRVLICESQDHLPLVKGNGNWLRNRYQERAESVQVYSTNPLRSADSISAHLVRARQAKPQYYLVDITTFTRECLMILLSLLRLRLKPTDTCHFIYNLAKDYSVGDPIEKKWLAKGISEIRSVLAYPGEWRPSRKIHLILLVGIEYERAVKFIDAFEPATVSLGFCEDAETVTLNKLGHNDIFYERLRNSYLNVNGSFQFPCLDPIHTRDVILQQIAAKPNYNVAVAPLNNKVSTVGASLAALENADIQLCYAQASQYNFAKYSEPSEKFCLFEIPDFLHRT